jgi:hypothetical protein
MTPASPGHLPATYQHHISHAGAHAWQTEFNGMRHTQLPQKTLPPAPLVAHHANLAQPFTQTPQSNFSPSLSTHASYPMNVANFAASTYAQPTFHRAPPPQTVPADNSPETNAKFEEAFRDFEIQDKLEEQRMEEELEEEMGTWMAEHGPERSAPVTVDASSKLTEEQQKPDPLLSDIRQPPSDQQAAANEELAKTAAEIITSVSASQNSKFHNSSFMRLMQQVARKEVVLQGDDFVDADSGGRVANSVSNQLGDVPV